MRPLSLTTSTMAGLILLSASASVSLAQSAVFDLSKRTGPSRFVSEADGKPVQVGVPGDKRRIEPGVVSIVPAPQVADAPDALPDPVSGDEPQDKQPPDGQPPSTNQPPGAQATSSTPDDGAACDPDCGDD